MQRIGYQRDLGNAGASNGLSATRPTLRGHISTVGAGGNERHVHAGRSQFAAQRCRPNGLERAVAGFEQ